MLSPRSILKLALLVLLAASPLHAQQGAASGPPLSVVTTSLPKAFLHQPYRQELLAEGGITPLRWEVTEGSLPNGMMLSSNGVLSGAPETSGDFRFTVTVTDSGKPAVQRNQPLVLHVVTPLSIEWSRYPVVNGQKVEGAVKVSNSTDQDFDLTVVVVAVNEIGRATALGYQHFSLKRATEDFEITFSQNLPFGSYEVNADAVGEVASANAIYRARLVTRERLQVRQEP
jgi:hypothetical protein